MIFYFSLAVIVIAILSGFLMMYKLPSPGTEPLEDVSTERKAVPSLDSLAIENDPVTRKIRHRSPSSSQRVMSKCDYRTSWLPWRFRIFERMN